MRAGFSHSPVVSGRERYVFYSMPHIGIAPDGIIGSIYRPGQTDPSTACGALISLLSQFKGDRRAVPRAAANAASSHTAADPEITMLRNKLALHLQRAGVDLKTLYLPEFTQFAERVITADLEALIRNTVDISMADYAVVTGVQVHSWPKPGTGEPLLEFVAPRVAYTVCGGVRREMNLQVCADAALPPGPASAAPHMHGGHRGARHNVSDSVCPAPRLPELWPHSPHNCGVCCAEYSGSDAAATGGAA